MKTFFVFVTLSSLAVLTSCNKPAAENKEVMYANAKRMSDSIEKLVDNALNSVSITPTAPTATTAAADTTKK